jgi:hypothetical protein
MVNVLRTVDLTYSDIEPDHRRRKISDKVGEVLAKAVFDS